MLNKLDSRHMITPKPSSNATRAVRCRAETVEFYALKTVPEPAT
jgi:hypothetical protein